MRPVGASAAAFGLLALLLSWLALAELSVPRLTARVTDLTATLTEAERQALEQRLAAFETEKGSQLAVLIVPSTRPETVEQYAIRVAEAWRLGRKGVDDGILLLVAKDDRVVRIEVGYGLEGVIPDAVAKRIIEEAIIPRFRTGDYSGGLSAGIEALIGRIAGEPLPPPVSQSHGSGSIPGQALPLAMMFVFVVGGLLRSLLGRLPGASLAAAVAFLGAWWLLGSFIAALIIAFIAFVLTLIGVSAGGGYRGGRGGSGWGGGGFSGGGGSFGGGGASGRW